MAVKTITIDMDAYELLAAQKRAGESFSVVIKRRLKPASTADGLLRGLSRISLSEDTLDAVDGVIRARRRSMAKSPRLDE